MVFPPVSEGFWGFLTLFPHFSTSFCFCSPPGGLCSGEPSDGHGLWCGGAGCGDCRHVRVQCAGAAWRLENWG
jgi:hypothetical protein